MGGLPGGCISASDIKILIKYLDLGKTKVIWDIN